MKTTATVFSDCPFCGRRIGLNKLGRMAKHGHSKWTRNGCTASGWTPYGAATAVSVIVGVTAMGTWARMTLQSTGE